MPKINSNKKKNNKYSKKCRIKIKKQNKHKKRLKIKIQIFLIRFWKSLCKYKINKTTMNTINRTKKRLQPNSIVC